jgi:hypothetical protein
MHRFPHNLSAILLVMAMVVAGLAEPISMQPQHTSHSRHAGCHEPMPAPKPADFACCTTGHDAALVPAIFSLIFSATPARNEDVSFTVAKRSCSNAHREILTSGDSPGAIPLRV